MFGETCKRVASYNNTNNIKMKAMRTCVLKLGDIFISMQVVDMLTYTGRTIPGEDIFIQG